MSISLYITKLIADGYSYGMLIGLKVIVCNKDNSINITRLCSENNRKFNDWKKLDSSEELLRYYGESDIIHDGLLQGTYVHIEIAIPVIYWINPWHFSLELDSYGSYIEANKGYIYIITSDEYKKRNLYKIGMAKNTDRRLKNIQSVCLEDLYIIHNVYYTDMQKLKNDIHKLYSEQLVKGEWFRIEDIDECIQTINRMAEISILI